MGIKKVKYREKQKEIVMLKNIQRKKLRRFFECSNGETIEELTEKAIERGKIALEPIRRINERRISEIRKRSQVNH